MKSILRVVLWLVPAVLGIIEPSTLACSPPPPETVALTWQPLAKITVIPDIDSITAATTAMNNWNTASFYYCYAPIFTVGPGTGETMTVNYVPIPADPNGTNTKRKNNDHQFGSDHVSLSWTWCPRTGMKVGADPSGCAGMMNTTDS